MSKSTSAPVEGPKLFRLPDGSRSTNSPWVWRGMFFMSLVAFGLCLTFAVGHRALLATAWGIITAGWLVISMWLWRRHLQVTE